MTSTHTAASMQDKSQGIYIGLMSGTSLDGLDAVAVRFTEHNTQPITLLGSVSQPFTERLYRVLLALTQPDGYRHLTSPANWPNLVSELDWYGWAAHAYAHFAADVVQQLLSDIGIAADAVTAIGCHGQTVRHRPALHFTLQLVDANVLAQRTGITVVSDFRGRDMAVGGQGAPLAPAFHAAMLSHPKTDRVVVNLGGIANITVLPADKTASIVGYDTGTANMLLDAWCQQQLGKPYDQNGAWAASGCVHSPLLVRLLAHPYFGLPVPKSTGREDFHIAWLNEQIAALSQVPSAKDVQATLAEFTVHSLAESIVYEQQRLQLTAGEIIVCGGGAYNQYVLARLQTLLPHWQVVASTAWGINPMHVESMAFAWLARQTLLGRPGNLPDVTGANQAVVLGQVCAA